MLTVINIVEYCTIKLCVARSCGDLNPGQGNLEGDGLEDHRQLRRTRWRRQRVKNIMFGFESKICFIKNIVRWNSQDQVVTYLIKSDVRIRRRPFQWKRGIVGIERRIVFLSRARVEGTDIQGLVGCFSGDTT